MTEDFNDDEFQPAYAPSQEFAPAPVATAPPPMMGGLPAPGPGQYRTAEGVLINGAPPPPPPDLDRSAAIADLYRRVPIDQANKAIAAATRLEGMLGFDADRKAGVPIMEALQKWSPKMYADHPAAIASLQRAAAIKPAVPFVPNQVTVGGKILTQMSPNRYAHLDDAAFTPREVELGGNKYVQLSKGSFGRVPTALGNDMRTKEDLKDINRELASIEKQIAAAPLPSSIPPLQAQKAVLKKQKQAMLEAASAGTKGATTPSVKRLVWKDGQLVPKE